MSLLLKALQTLIRSLMSHPRAGDSLLLNYKCSKLNVLKSALTALGGKEMWMKMDEK